MKKKVKKNAKPTGPIDLRAKKTKSSQGLVEPGKNKKKEHQPPIAPEKKHPITVHGDTRVDEYFWLRDKENPDTLNYLNAENDYFFNQMHELSSLQNKVYKKLRSRVIENQSSVPAPRGFWLYQTLFKKGFEYPVFRRSLRVAPKKFDILLDINKIAKNKKYTDVKTIRVSPSGEALVYSVDHDGSEQYALFHLDLTTKKLMDLKIKKTSGNVVWAQDNLHLFYTQLDENLRPYQVYRHKLFASEPDVLVYEERDPRFFVSIEASHSGNFLFIGAHGKITSEVWVLDAHHPTLPARCFRKRQDGVEYHLEHQGQRFLVFNNFQAENFQIQEYPIQEFYFNTWTEKGYAIKEPDLLKLHALCAHDDKALIVNLQAFANYVVVARRLNGIPEILIYKNNFNSIKESQVNGKNSKPDVLKMPDDAYHFGIHTDNLEYCADKLRLSYSSPIQPQKVLEYDFSSKKIKVLQETKIKGHKPQNYRLKRIWVKSHDGVEVPLVIVHHKKFKRDGSAPGYLYGYGSYGYGLPDAFAGRRDPFSLIDQGFVYATAHIRGGDELGRWFYLDGKFLKKKNTFLDFIACAEYLKKHKWVNEKQLAISGGSAGGLLVGASFNLKPELFNLVVAHVPFVDVLNTMLDKDLPLTQTEYDEWGNPEQSKEYYEYIKGYSPYDNLKEMAYPDFFVTCGLNDPRVTYWEPAKWIARIRKLNTRQGAKILFKTNMGFGHFGSSGRYSYLVEIAEEYAFILNRLSGKA